MAFTFSAQYTPDVENCMRGFYQTLSEKDQRRFAALEANRLGFGGIQYIAKVLGCSRRTIERAAEEIQALPHDPAAGRVRRPGGGRKKKSPATRNSKTT
jgi:transcriptional antiterminator